jgi:uncharacterized protein YoxC
MASTSKKAPEGLEELLAYFERKGADIKDVNALETALKGSEGKDLLRILTDKLDGAELKDFLASPDVSIKGLIGDARTGVYTTLHKGLPDTDAFKEYKIDKAFSKGAVRKDIQEYIDQELKLVAEEQEAVSKLARKATHKAVIDDVIGKFGTEMPKKFGSDSVNAWAREYEKKLDKLPESAAVEEKEAAKLAAEKAREIADTLSTEINHAKATDGSLKRAEGYGREMQKLSNRSKELGKDIDEASKELEKSFDKIIEKVEDAYRDINKDVRKALKIEGPQHASDKIVDRVKTAAEKFGKVEGEFVERFASKATKAAGEIGGETSKAAETWFLRDKNKGMWEKLTKEGKEVGNLKKVPAFAALAGVTLLGSWALGAFKSKNPSYEAGTGRTA